VQLVGASNFALPRATTVSCVLKPSVGLFCGSCDARRGRACLAKRWRGCTRDMQTVPETVDVRSVPLDQCKCVSFVDM
jgi:hypothetical protein